MKGIIRWPGLISFALVMGAIVLFFALFFESLLRVGLQAGLSRVNGAEVNIAQLDIQRAPFAVTLQGLEMTDPEMPELNRFQAEQLRAEVAFLELLIGRVHIHELSAQGVRFAQERAQVGTVRTRDEGDDADQRIDWRERLQQFDIQLPTTESFLAGADIRTPQLVDRIEADFKTREAELRRVRDNLPEPEVVRDYQARIDALLEQRPRNPRELLAAREALNEIKRDMERDRSQVREFMQVTRGAVDGAEQDFQALRASYEHDMDRARRLFSTDPEALTELTGLLFGERVEQWAQYGLIAFDFIAPMLARAQEEDERPSRWQGRHIEFDAERTPTFWVKQAAFDLMVQEASLTATLRDLTWQHDRLGRATRFTVDTERAPWWQSLNLDGDFYLNAEGAMRGAQRWRLQGAQLAEMSLVNQREFSAELAQALLNSEGEIRLDRGALAGGGKLVFEQVDFATGGSASWARYFEQALASVSAFDINLGVSGQMARPRFRMDSNLDNQLESTLRNMARAEADVRLAEVRSSLTQARDGLRSEWQPWLERAQLLREQGAATEQILTELLSVEIGDSIDAERSRLLRRLGDRLGGN